MKEGDLPLPDSPRASEPGHARPEDCLAGGGEMGARMRSMNWADTPLGPVASWPQSLRTAVSIMLESAFGMVVAWGPEFIFLYNDRYRPVLGGTKHPGALGVRSKDIFPEAWDFIGPLFEKTRRGEAVALDDVPIPLDRNGYLEDCYFTLSYSPIRDETGGVGGMLAIVAETTERVEAERRLTTLRDLAALAEARSAEEACAQAERVLSNNPTDVPFSLLYLVEPDGRHARRVGVTGLDRGSIAAPPRVTLGLDDTWGLGEATDDHAPVVLRDLSKRFPSLPGGPHGEAPHSALVLPMLRAAYERPYGFFIAGVSPRRALDERYRTFFELGRDQIVAAIGNALAHEEERKRAEALAEIDQAKTVFFSNVSHEFRTPLTLMMGPLEDILAGRYGEAPPAMRQHLDLTYRSSLRLKKLVDSLLEFARIEAGRMRATFEPIDLSAATTEIASTFRSAVERAGLRFVVDCPPLPGPVHVDVEMWEKIVLNLVSNALKFTFEGEIAVTLRAVGDTALLEVRDTGTGIVADELPNLFKRFHRIQGARSRTHEGSGIGLALVRDLLRLHGGEIQCDSEVDRGTSFKATIRTGTDHLPSDQIGRVKPRVISRAVAEMFVAEAVRWIPEVARDTDVGPLAGKARLLIVDDNADMRAYLQRILGERWLIETAANGAEALEQALRDPPDLVLADVMMPVLDGFGLLRELRLHELTQSVPVVMLSARAGEESRIEGLDAGADDYLVKPFSARELIARVNSQLKLAHARQRERRARKEADLQRDALSRTLHYNEMFAGILGHDLRNPLSAILAAADLLLLRSRDDKVTSPARRILAGGQRMARMIDQLLDFTRIRLGGGLALERRTVDVLELSRRVLGELDDGASEPRVRVEVDGDTVGQWDADRLAQVLSNLAANALQHGTEGPVQIRLDGGALDAVTISLENGGRIPEDLLPEIFEPFRAAAGRRPGSKGLGLGLFISREIVTAHGGDLLVTCTTSSTRFTITLPRTPS